jgi:hypothetical protein
MAERSHWAGWPPDPSCAVRRRSRRTYHAPAAIWICPSHRRGVFDPSQVSVTSPQTPKQFGRPGDMPLIASTVVRHGTGILTVVQRYVFSLGTFARELRRPPPGRNHSCWFTDAAFTSGCLFARTCANCDAPCDLLLLSLDDLAAELLEFCIGNRRPVARQSRARMMRDYGLNELHVASRRLSADAEEKDQKRCKATLPKIMVWKARRLQMINGG